MASDSRDYQYIDFKGLMPKPLYGAQDLHNRFPIHEENKVTPSWAFNKTAADFPPTPGVRTSGRGGTRESAQRASTNQSSA